MHIIVYKVQTQEPIKDYCKNKFKTKASAQDSKPSDKVKKDKKKKYQNNQRDSINLASGVNKAEVSNHKG